MSQDVSRRKRKKRGEKKIIRLDRYILKEENLSYLGTLHFGTLCFLASDSPFITQAEVTASTVPHLTVVPDSTIIQAASLGRHTLLTALPRTLHFVLPLQNISNHWAGLSEPVGTGTVIRAARWMIFNYLLTVNRVTGLSQTSDFPSVTSTCGAGVFFPLFAMLFKKNTYATAQHPS